MANYKRTAGADGIDMIDGFVQTTTLLANSNKRPGPAQPNPNIDLDACNATFVQEPYVLHAIAKLASWRHTAEKPHAYRLVVRTVLYSILV